MILQKMIDNVSDNLGKRTNGRIGSRTVEAVALDGVNMGMSHVILEAQPDYYNRVASLSLTTLVKEYALPTQDEDANTIRIKDIHGNRCFRADGTEICLTQLNNLVFIERTADYELDFQATPRYFALWGQENKLHLDCFPSEALTLRLFVSIHTPILTETSLNITLPIHDQWNLVIESFSTAYCYLKLQQIDMYRQWDDLYRKQKAAVSRDENEKHGKNLSVQGQFGRIADPLHNPFVQRYN